MNFGVKEVVSSFCSFLS